jgi:alpha-N-acetylglucosamine transferase
MSRGIVLFAHNSQTVDYFSIAKLCARRVNQYLDLPVTLITDAASIEGQEHNFDRVFVVEADDSNKRKKTNWINKGRYQAFDLSPYDDTILLDSDYLVNSAKLLKLFDLPSDFVCHNTTRWLTNHQPGELLNPLAPLGIETLWATVVRFKKTARAHDIFSMVKTVQYNYEHYSNVYGFLHNTFRNDYALTIAHKVVNGHLMPSEDFIPWSLVHVSNEVKVIKDSDTRFNMEFYSNLYKKNCYITVENLDFHMLGKTNFGEIA